MPFQERMQCANTHFLAFLQLSRDIATNTYLDTLQQCLKSQLDFVLKFQLAMPPARHRLTSLLSSSLESVDTVVRGDVLSFYSNPK